MKESKRAIRRHHKERMKAIARKVYPNDRQPARLADNMCHCSKWCCGHKRQHLGPTIQERRLTDAKLASLRSRFDADDWNRSPE